MYEEQVINIIKKETAFMASVDGNRPRIRPMRVFVDDTGHLWMFSRYDSQKVAALQANPRVELAFSSRDKSYLTIYGSLNDQTKPGTPEYRVIRDFMLKTFPNMDKYFKEGEQDSFILYKLDVHEVHYMLPNREVTSQVNLPMTYSAETDVAFCKGGFCLFEDK